MESDITKRIKEYVLYKGIRVNQFEQLCNLSNGYVNQIKRSIGEEKLKTISRRFPDLNISWVLTGIGNMIQNQDIKDSNNNKTIKEAIIQRIKEIIENKSLSESQFSKLISANQKTINQQLKGERGISIDTILSILSSFEHISSEWLLRGKGNMFKSIDKFISTEELPESNRITSKTTYEKLLEEYTRQTEELLSQRDKEIRVLQLENARLKAEAATKEAV
ncbi:hypothetical protein [Bacteroides fragilis]|jgi:transcriptional regulator with XRE-family HTH domain|uniref:hypothetical protein n=1 Tax=Bacteroides fragilis TaxID=817 RepID=UPI001FF99949|nr:hypothetical protein [Bacteroides fragilis]MCS2991530.1 hypothetical protein [Bacteroides fragilis]MCZ2643568.1 hypothetical protein [Bacteroides fragilis]MCZ2651625.1 hypothetical protein [Bacteroides fragilis]DAH67803.1 MAG TPA: repressor protein [Caudoviricetes sp.]